MGCMHSKHLRHTPGHEEPSILVAKTPFTVSEVEALYELYKKISSSIIDDGLIHKEEFQLALFRNKNMENLFADRIFDLFDYKRNGVIEFGEFVRSLGVFHPSAPVTDKIAFAFRLYDLRQIGYIERKKNRHIYWITFHYPKSQATKVEVPSGFFLLVCRPSLMLKEMVVVLLHESDLELSNGEIELIVDKTFSDADINGDGKIDEEEWKEFVSKNPSLIKNMTLPYLTDITLAFPSFIVCSEVEDSDIYT